MTFQVILKEVSSLLRFPEVIPPLREEDLRKIIASDSPLIFFQVFTPPSSYAEITGIASYSDQPLSCSIRLDTLCVRGEERRYPGNTQFLLKDSLEAVREIWPGRRWIDTVTTSPRKWKKVYEGASFRPHGVIPLRMDCWK